MLSARCWFQEVGKTILGYIRMIFRDKTSCVVESSIGRHGNLPTRAKKDLLKLAVTCTARVMSYIAQISRSRKLLRVIPYSTPCQIWNELPGPQVDR